MVMSEEKITNLFFSEYVVCIIFFEATMQGYGQNKALQLVVWMEVCARLSACVVCFWKCLVSPLEAMRSNPDFEYLSGMKWNYIL